MQRILLLTHQLRSWTGSETIIAELAEYFNESGFNVSIHADFMTRSFTDNFVKIGVRVLSEPSDVHLSEFDIIYCQHQVITKFVDQLMQFDNSQKQPKIIYGHLSPYEVLEYPGATIEYWFADCIICNSEETKLRVQELGMSKNLLQLFPNPAPDPFFDVNPRGSSRPSVLIVSNHVPREVRDAAKLLRKKGFHVRYRGSKYVSKRVVPGDIEKQDIILTIGKTVQYAIAARRAVYVYDHFGGPGWLNEDNFMRAADFNFSGRCTREKRSAEAICTEIVDGYANAVVGANAVARRREAFRLSTIVKSVFLETSSNSKAREHAFVFGEEQKFAFIREFYHHMDRTTLRGHLIGRRPKLGKRLVRWTRGILFGLK